MIFFNESICSFICFLDICVYLYFWRLRQRIPIIIFDEDIVNLRNLMGKEWLYSCPWGLLDLDSSYFLLIKRSKRFGHDCWFVFNHVWL